MGPGLGKQKEMATIYPFRDCDTGIKRIKALVHGGEKQRKALKKANKLLKVLTLIQRRFDADSSAKKFTNVWVWADAVAL